MAGEDGKMAVDGRMRGLEHIGDGVYVGNDGFHIWLGANHHENMTVALEPAVFVALVRYAATTMGWEVKVK